MRASLMEIRSQSIVDEFYDDGHVNLHPHVCHDDYPHPHL